MSILPNSTALAQYPPSALTPEHDLACAILRTAWTDARSPAPRVRREARAFWTNEAHVQFWDDALGLAGALQRYAALLRTTDPTASLPAQLNLFAWEDVR